MQECAVEPKVLIEEDKCRGCELCVVYCPAKYLELSKALNKKGVSYARVKEQGKCLGCGVCFVVCPHCCIE